MTSIESIVTLVKAGGISLNSMLLMRPCLTLKSDLEVNLVGERHEPYGLKMHGLFGVGQIVDRGAERARAIELLRVRQRTADGAVSLVGEEAVSQADAKIGANLVDAAELDERAAVDRLVDIDLSGFVVQVESLGPLQVVVADLNAEVDADVHLATEESLLGARG
jgi:hypothetical protein